MRAILALIYYRKDKVSRLLEVTLERESTRSEKILSETTMHRGSRCLSYEDIIEFQLNELVDVGSKLLLLWLKNLFARRDEPLRGSAKRSTLDTETACHSR